MKKRDLEVIALRNENLELKKTLKNLSKEFSEFLCDAEKFIKKRDSSFEALNNFVTLFLGSDKNAVFISQKAVRIKHILDSKQYLIPKDLEFEFPENVVPIETHKKKSKK